MPIISSKGAASVSALGGIGGGGFGPPYDIEFLVVAGGASGGFGYAGGGGGGADADALSAAESAPSAVLEPARSPHQPRSFPS